VRLEVERHGTEMGAIMKRARTIRDRTICAPGGINEETIDVKRPN